MSENDRRLARAAQTMHAYRVLIYGRSGYAVEPLGQSVRDLLADLCTGATLTKLTSTANWKWPAITTRWKRRANTEC